MEFQWGAHFVFVMYWLRPFDSVVWLVFLFWELLMKKLYKVSKIYFTWITFTIKLSHEFFVAFSFTNIVSWRFLNLWIGWSIMKGNIKYFINSWVIKFGFIIFLFGVFIHYFNRIKFGESIAQIEQVILIIIWVFFFWNWAISNYIMVFFVQYHKWSLYSLIKNETGENLIALIGGSYFIKTSLNCNSYTTFFSGDVFLEGKPLLLYLLLCFNLILFTFLVSPSAQYSSLPTILLWCLSKRIRLSYFGMLDNQIGGGGIYQTIPLILNRLIHF